LGGDITTSAGPVLNDEGLPEMLRQPLSDQPRDDVVTATGSEAHDDAHRPRRIGLRPREARYRLAGASRPPLRWDDPELLGAPELS
jgi:hypothetical protein